MRAVFYEEYGAPSVLRHGDVADAPAPGPGQVRVAMRVAGVNPIDIAVRSGAMADGPPASPVVPGSDGAGVVDAVGPDVVGMSVGDAVLGMGSSTYAEHALLSEVALCPPELSWEVAAAIPMAAETAGRGLRAIGVGAGDTVVVTGASGGVGSFVAQLAVRQGARVIGTASPSQHPFVESLGATAVSYGDGLVERVRAAASGGVDAVYDTTGFGAVAELVGLVDNRSRIVTIADFGAADFGVQVSDGSSGRAPDVIGEVALLAAAGDFVVRIGEVIPWSESARAHELVASGQSRGRVVLTIS